MEFSTVLFTGGTGLLGRHMRPLMRGALFPGRAEFDVTSPSGMAVYLDGKTVSTIFHAAAFTSPPKINQDPKLALDVNIVGTANLVRVCMERNIRLLYVSTDYVFKGDTGMYKEDDPVLPVNKYAWSKLAGEVRGPHCMTIHSSFGRHLATRSFLTRRRSSINGPRGFGSIFWRRSWSRSWKVICGGRSTLAAGGGR